MVFMPKPIFVGAIALFVFATASWADPIVTFQGSGAYSSLSFQFDATVPFDTPGLLGIFSFVSCNPPAGESCGQVDYSAPSGVIRFVGLVNAGGTDIATFDFADYVNNGVYTTIDGSPDSGTVTVTGSTDAVPEPSSVALAGFGLAFLLARRTILRRRTRAPARAV